MKPSRFHFVTWLMDHSGWSLYCAVVSLFGLTAYYADLLRPRVPDWVAVGLLTVPIVIVIFVQWGEAPDRVVAVAPVVAASWFMALALGMEAGILLGHAPRGTILYRIFAHLGWTFAWGGIYRRARAHSRAQAQRGATPPGGRATPSPGAGAADGRDR